MLHILNGDATRRVFEQTHLKGDVLVWRDILVEGPAAPPDERAPWLAAHLGIDAGEYVCGRREEAAALAAAAGHDEIALWFEHDLFCAVNLWFLLDWFAARVGTPPRLSLVYPTQDDPSGAGDARRRTPQATLRAPRAGDQRDTRPRA